MMDIQPLTDTFVADIYGIDVGHLSDAAFDQLYAAWLKYGVLRLRNQEIGEDQLQAFSARFGPLEEAPFGRMSQADKAKIKNRYVTQLSNILVDGTPIGGLGRLLQRRRSPRSSETTRATGALSRSRRTMPRSRECSPRTSARVRACWAVQAATASSSSSAGDL